MAGYINVCDPFEFSLAEEAYNIMAEEFGGFSNLMARLRWVELGRTNADLFMRALFYP